MKLNYSLGESFNVASVDSVIIYFGQKISESVAKDVRSAFYALKNAKIESITELVPSYTSIMVTYNFLKISHKDICKKIDEVLRVVDKSCSENRARLISIPVYYGLEVGLDLQKLSKIKNRSIDEIISLHVDKEYFVYVIGFSPGFPYMGEVDPILATSRLANPRAKVPKGSVGIADNQTAIYPQSSPGGWQILGRTPIELFDTSYDGFSYLKVGDRVKFKQVNKKQFLELGGKL
ncbi:MAG: 5-oxoprolinase subunit PxpB [Sulfurospirillum sp.]|nr:5-oxoprolinase subunit PxpB [Sulfurospirillum sp.]MBL0703198.1 5-oxoprolinase subunit PxpB [Sulfurospirillum sp.]